MLSRQIVDLLLDVYKLLPHRPLRERHCSKTLQVTCRTVPNLALIRAYGLLFWSYQDILTFLLCAFLLVACLSQVESPPPTDFLQSWANYGNIELAFALTWNVQFLFQRHAAASIATSYLHRGGPVRTASFSNIRSEPKTGFTKHVFFSEAFASSVQRGRPRSSL